MDFFELTICIFCFFSLSFGGKKKVSWMKQHSAPTAGISFSPSNDKVSFFMACFSFINSDTTSSRFETVAFSWVWNLG